MNQSSNMNYPEKEKEFWDSLQSEIIISNQNVTEEDFSYIIEKNFMFSMFFRGTSHKELILFKSYLRLKETGYMIVLELLPRDTSDYNDVNINDEAFYSFLKKTIPNHIPNAIGPMITNRISILLSEDGTSAEEITKHLINQIQEEYQITSFAGIGNVQSLQNIYTSFIEALSCMHRCQPGQTIHAKDLTKMESDHHFEYIEAERHMLESIRLRRSDAYDYFILMMNYLKPMNDQTKRNKIIETLILASRNAQIDKENSADYFNYTGQICNLLDLNGEDLIEWAFQKFFYITGFVNPTSSIDYTNKIVQATKEYLEAHYAEEISLEDVAEQVNISPQYFSKLIKKNTGFNFIDWLSMLRVKKAKELLTNSNYTVKEVCFMVGYKDPNYFSRIFKKRMGITPSEFIKNKTSFTQKK